MLHVTGMYCVSVAFSRAMFVGILQDSFLLLQISPYLLKCPCMCVIDAKVPIIFPRPDIKGWGCKNPKDSQLYLSWI